MTPERALTVAIEVRRTDSFLLAVEFVVPPGITILFGPSGAGKSTVLAAIAGLVAPSGGRITLGEQVWFDRELGIARPVHRRKIAYVFQRIALFPHFTAAENVAYGMDRALSRRQRRARAEEMLERMRVRELADRRPATFSGGEAQRVALARAFATSPDVLLLDEAFSAMDRNLRHELGQDVRRFVDEHRIPALHVTHHRVEARALGDRALLMEAGRITRRGSVEAILADSGGGGRDVLL